MKPQLYYSAFIFVLVTVLFVFRHSPVYYEHDMKFAFELGGCKVYRFKSFDGRNDKLHYFTSCKGNTIDPDEVNFTEAERNEENRY